MEDIAVVGVGLRFPGDASSPQELWKVLEGSESQWSEFPEDRLNIEGYFHPGGDRQGSISFRGAHFLKGDVAAFDAPFFSISAEDAKSIDPQQRFLLEVCYEALENAGLRKEDLDGSDTSVYVGSFVKDYEQICLRDPDWQPRYAATGNGIAIMANRISYFFNFHGPSMTIDTGCSGSLVSIHLAAQSLRSGESSVAIGAGCGMILTPNTIMPMTALNFLSPDGKCFTFDSRANGYGRGEGIGVVVMKRLSDALRDNDTIRAVIRGTSVNQDGRTTGITLPSKEAQVANIRAVYASAGLSFDQTAYVECHGTGTQAGDWRELKAISETLGSVRPTEKPIVVGSVKPNIGHLEGAAGVAGIIKGILTLEHGKIPPNINFEKGNPDIDFENWRVKVPRSVMDWPMAGLRRVSVNCFGFGGTNAHVILDEAPGYLSERGLSGHHSSLDTAAVASSKSNGLSNGLELEASKGPLQLFCYSSHEKAGLGRLMSCHLDYLLSDGKLAAPDRLRDYAYTLGCRRSNLEWKGFLVADSLADLEAKAQAFDDSTVVRSSRDRQPRIAFIFCGQGAQWAQMGKGLMHLDVFRRSLEEASLYTETVLQPSFDLLAEILRDEKTTSISQPHIAQPATTAIQVALVDLLNSLGIAPRCVAGHSSGEIAAAYAAGVLSKQAAWEVAYYRGLAAASIPIRAPKLQGGMIVVGMSRHEAERYLASINKSAQVACINSPRSTTISGRVEAIDFIDHDLREKKVFARRLAVQTAYHSSHMKLVEHDYRDSLAWVTPRDCEPSVSMFSSVTGHLVKGSELDAAYWATNLVSPVEYVAAVEAMMSLPEDEQPTAIIELSPSPALRSPTLDILAATAARSPPTYHPVLDPRANSVSLLLNLVGTMWSLGCPVKMKSLFLAAKKPGQPQPKCLSDLPPYPWNHAKSYWHESHLSLANRFREFGRQDLIGAPTADSVPFEPRWRGFLRVSENPWIQDHQVQKTIVYPAAGMVSMVLEGAMQMSRRRTDLLGYEIQDMRIEKAMIIPNTGHGLEVALNIKSSQESHGNESHGPDSAANEFAIYSKHLGHDWERNASGSLRVRTKSDGWTALFDVHAARLAALEETCTERLNPRQLYEFLDTIGMNYGPLFQNMVDIRKGGDSCLSQVRVPDTRSKMPAKFEYPHLLHPATLDSMFQTLFAIDAAPMVPTFIKKLFVSANVSDSGTEPFSGYATASRSGIRDAEANIAMRRSGGGNEAHVVIEGLHLTGLSNPLPSEGGFLPNHRNLCTEIVWNQDVTFASPSLYSEQVMLLAHKYPALNLLQVGGGLAATKATLKLMGQDETPRLARYTIVNLADPEASTAALQHVQGTNLESFVEAKADCDSLSAEYHLVVVFEDSGVDANSLKKHLRNGGILLKQEKSPVPALGSGETTRLQFDGLADTGSPVWMEVTKKTRPLAGVGSANALVVMLPQSPNTEALAFHDGLKQLMQDEGYMSLSLTSMTADKIVDEAASLAGKVVISLLDFSSTGAEGCSVFEWSDSDFEAFTMLQKTAKGIIWVTRGAHMKPLNPKGAPIIALARTLMSEDPLKTIVNFDLDLNSRLDRLSLVGNILAVYRQTFHERAGSEPRETEYAEECDRLYIPRLQPVWSLNQLIENGTYHGTFVQRPFQEKGRDTILKLTIGTPGLSDDSLYYTEVDKSELGPDEVEIIFEEAALTQLDLETVLGRTAQSTVGLDVVGRVKRVGSKVVEVRPDERVTALAKDGSIRSKVRTKSSFVSSYRPGQVLSLDVSAYMAIVHFGRAGPGRKVLIQAGASAFGLAAVKMAMSVGADALATIFGPDASQQRDILLRCGLPEERILDARSDDFMMAVQAATAGRGVDVVYNPTREYIEASLKCVRKCGTVVQFANKSPSPRALPTTESPATVVNFDLGQLMEEEESFVADMLARTTQHVSNRTADAPLRPETEQLFGMEKLVDSLRHIQSSPYVGYVSLRVDAEGANMVPVMDKKPTKPLEESLDVEGTYLLAGGLGGLGRSISELLIEHGVRHLAYLSRSGARGEKAKEVIEQLQGRGIDARAYSVDICDAQALAELVRTRLRSEMPPVKGVFQCAAVIKDAVFDNMSFSDWDTAIKPKTVGSWNLVKTMSDTGEAKPFFIFLASSAGVIGNRGQANYAAGNCFEDALARYCRYGGMHSVAIDLGPVLGAGMLAEDEEILNILRASGFYGIRHGDFLEVVQRAITNETLSGAKMPAQVVLGVGTGGIIRQNQPADPYWSRTALYSYLNLVDMPRPDLSASEGDAGGSGGKDLKTMLACCTDVASAADIVRAGLINMLAKAMNMLPEELDENKPPNAYGVDSLVAVGVRNFVISNFGVQVSVFEVLSDDTIAEMAKSIAERGKFGGAERA